MRFSKSSGFWKIFQDYRSIFEDLNDFLDLPSTVKRFYREIVSFVGKDSWDFVRFRKEFQRDFKGFVKNFGIFKTSQYFLRFLNISLDFIRKYTRFWSYLPISSSLPYKNNYEMVSAYSLELSFTFVLEAKGYIRIVCATDCLWNGDVPFLGAFCSKRNGFHFQRLY